MIGKPSGPTGSRGRSVAIKATETKGGWSYDLGLVRCSLRVMQERSFTVSWFSSFRSAAGRLAFRPFRKRANKMIVSI